MLVDEYLGVKVGDMVRCTVLRDPWGTELFPIGTVGTVTRIDTEAKLNFRIEITDNGYDRCWFVYSRDMFELIGNLDETSQIAKDLAIIKITRVQKELRSRTFFQYADDEENRYLNWNDVVDVFKKCIDELCLKGE